MTHHQMSNLGIHVDEMPEWELDVVCGMDVDPRTTTFHHEYKGQVYYFCNNSCLRHFRDNPENYVA